jgi:molecular chaperone DnaK
VFQGESHSCSENTPIGSFFYPLEPAPAHSPVVVEFAYDREGLVRICVDQKGFDNRKEVTLDIRNRKIEDAPSSAPAETPVNYVAEKARRLAADKRLAENVRNEVLEVVADYEAAIRTGEDETRVDELEDQLLELLERAEEELEGRE